MATKATADGATNGGRRVGLLYDDRMCRHQPPKGVLHIENCNRIKVIWNTLRNSGVSRRCVLLKAKEARIKNLLLVHGKDHVNLIKNVSSQASEHRARVAEKFNSIYLNEGSSQSAFLAVGSVMEAAERVAVGDLNSAFAVVRPPGHHAEPDEAMGFCIFNNVAIAAAYILDTKPELNIKKILIVDWDVHHGNGTQKIFWNDPRVLFFSVHRHDFGSFYPANDDGDYNMIGEAAGAGYNINVPWENGLCGDADYLAVWDHILIPVAKEFSPDMIIISAGFDAAKGDPLGGCCVTPNGYSAMLQKLMDFAHGKMVLALEGGYNFTRTADSALACVQTLLGDKPITSSTKAYPLESTWRVIQAVRHELKAFWPALADELSAELTSRKVSLDFMQIILSSSDSESEDEMLRNTAPSQETEEMLLCFLQPLASVKGDLSKVDVWYATFGPNMWKPRFMCYIEGGQVDDMQSVCTGSVDKSPPKEILWRTFPHRLFFGNESTESWDSGGVAFLHPQSSDDKTHFCLYKITAEQFNDVLRQENISSSMDSPLFNFDALSSAVEKGSVTLEAVKSGLYRNVVYLGKEQDIPILTVTCLLSDAEEFRCGKLPLSSPTNDYAMTLVRGLVEGGQFSEVEAAMAYIDDAATDPF